MKKPVKKLATIRIKVNREQHLALSETETGIVINPIEIDINGDQKIFRFKGLWFGDFNLTINDQEKTFIIDTSQKDKSIIKNVIVEIGHYYKITLIPRAFFIIFTPIYKKLFSFGWNYIFKISKIITVCKYLSKEAKDYTGKRSYVIPIPAENMETLNISKIELKHPAVILIQNHQIKQKSEALVDFKEVIESLPNVNFYISKGLPENRENKYYNNVIKTLTPLKNITFIDVNSDNKYDYLNSADIYVLRSGLDCTPATILEAGIMGKPVIASAVGGIPEMIIDGKTGWVIKNDDHRRWTSCILELVNNEELLGTMGKENKKYIVNNYSLDKISKKIFNIIT